MDPPSGTAQGADEVTAASAAPPAGQVLDVEIQRPGLLSFTSWQSGITTPSGTYRPDAGPGTYQFRARLRSTANGAATDWSPLASLVVH